LSGLTAVQMSEDVDARRIVDVACRRGQGLGSILEERGPFDLVLIMVGTNDLAMGVAPDMVLHSIQALHAECHRRGVRTVALGVPQSFFTLEDPSFGALSDEVNHRLKTWATGSAHFVDSHGLLPYDSTNGLWESDGLHFSKAGSREFGRRMATCVRELLRPQESVSLAGEVTDKPTAEELSESCAERPRSSLEDDVSQLYVVNDIVSIPDLASACLSMLHSQEVKGTSDRERGRAAKYGILAAGLVIVFCSFRRFRNR